MQPRFSELRTSYGWATPRHSTSPVALDADERWIPPLHERDVSDENDAYGRGCDASGRLDAPRPRERGGALERVQVRNPLPSRQ